MAIDKADFWDEIDANNPPLTDGMIEQAERMLKVRLPKSFIELLKIQNGGYTHCFAYPMKQATSWAEDHIPVDELFGIVPDDLDADHNILETVYMTEEWGLPEKQVLLCGDGHWWITLDYRNSDEPTVRWIDVECNEDIHVANTFEDFFNGLVSEEHFSEE